MGINIVFMEFPNLVFPQLIYEVLSILYYIGVKTHTH